jgi:hypothetical protein
MWGCQSPSPCAAAGHMNLPRTPKGNLQPAVLFSVLRARSKRDIPGLAHSSVMKAVCVTRANQMLRERTRKDLEGR